MARVNACPSGVWGSWQGKRVPFRGGGFVAGVNACPSGALGSWYGLTHRKGYVAGLGYSTICVAWAPLVTAAAQVGWPWEVKGVFWTEVRAPVLALSCWAETVLSVWLDV